MDAHLVGASRTKCWCMQCVRYSTFWSPNFNIELLREEVMSFTLTEPLIQIIPCIWIFIKIFCYQHWKWMPIFAIGKANHDAKPINSSKVRQSYLQQGKRYWVITDTVNQMFVYCFAAMRSKALNRIAKNNNCHVDVRKGDVLWSEISTYLPLWCSSDMWEKARNACFPQDSISLA